MPDRLGRTPFVGRQRELASLLAALEAAGRGQGRVTLIAGEPGIGKTRLLTEFAQQAQAEGWQVFAGRAYDSDGMPAYLPFTEALRDYVRALLLDHLRAQLDEAGPELALLAPDIRRRLPDLATTPSGSPEDQRYRLFESACDFLLAAPQFAEARGLVLILDDLHWADPSTLLLFQHLVRRLTSGSASVGLLAGAYRGQEVSRDHPLAAVLADLRREEAVERIALAPLGAAEIGMLVRGLTGDDAAPSVVAAIERRTEGNPFFVGELVRELVAEEHDLSQPETVAAWPAVPEGVREVIDRRLARLSAAANRLLQVAAVLGYSFSAAANRLLQVAAVLGYSFSAAALRAAAGEEAATLLTALDEALAAGMLRESGDGYEFSHALIRQTVYDGLSLVRRQHLHGQVAEALEERYAGSGSGGSEHAAELAEHFSQSTESAGLAKAVGYAELAAQRASGVYAYGEAVRHLERALRWQAVLDPDDKARRCDLLLALGEALVYAGEPADRVEEAAEKAYALAEAAADQIRAVRACRVALIILGTFGAGVSWAAQWTERIATHAEPDTADNVVAEVLLGSVAGREERWADCWAHRQRALALARRLDRTESLFTAALPVLNSPLSPANAAERYRLAEEFERKQPAGVGIRLAGLVLLACGVRYLERGERERWDHVARRVQTLGGRTQYPHFRLFPLRLGLSSAVHDGDLDGAITAAGELSAHTELLGAQQGGRLVAALVQGYLGRYDEALSGLDAADQPAGLTELGVVERAKCVALLAELGRVDEARAALRQELAQVARGDQLRHAPLQASASFLEAAVALGERDAASMLLQALSSTAPLFTDTCVARHLGAAAALLGDPEGAMRYYEQALDLAGRLRHRPELALTHLGMAELLLDAGNGSWVSGRGDGAGAGAMEGAAGAMNRTPTDGMGSGPDSVGARHASPSGPDVHAEAMRHLDIAIPELREMKMQPGLERALKLRDRASAPAAAALHTPAYPDGLSPREVEVLRLIAAGKSNQAIADELVISVNTVMRHITNLFVKIGAANRTEAANYAHRQGLA